MNSFDITETLAPTSDQLDAIELTTGPRIFQVESVSKGPVDQPVQVHLVDFPRPWRPGKSMRRVLAHCWGADASQWVGRRVELFFDPEVTFGKDKPGGTRIKRLSHIDGAQKIPLLVTRGKSALYTVTSLPEGDQASKQQVEPTAEQVAACTDKDELGKMWKRSGPERRTQIEQRVADLNNEPEAAS